MDTNEIELYKDIVKIGVPALVGLMAGLIPYFLERKKLQHESDRENRKFRRDQIVTLIDCYSQFAGNLSTLISMLLSKKFNGGDQFELELNQCRNKMFSNEVNLKKAKAIAALLDNSQLVNLFNEYDHSVSAAINLLGHPERKTDQEKEQTINTLRKKESELINLLNTLS